MKNSSWLNRSGISLFTGFILLCFYTQVFGQTKDVEPYARYDVSATADVAKFHLDNFAYELAKSKSEVATITYFTADRSSKKQSRRRAVLAKKYLVSVASELKSRIRIIDGGRVANTSVIALGFQ